MHCFIFNVMNSINLLDRLDVSKRLYAILSINQLLHSQIWSHFKAVVLINL